MKEKSGQNKIVDHLDLPLPEFAKYVDERIAQAETSEEMLNLLIEFAEADKHLCDKMNQSGIGRFLAKITPRTTRIILVALMVAEAAAIGLSARIMTMDGGYILLGAGLLAFNLWNAYGTLKRWLALN